MANQIISFRLNGEVIEIAVSPSEMLLDVLRENMHLTGTKRGCGKGECGACTIIFNGKAMNACLIPAMRAKGADIQTIEGVESPDGLHPLQQSFIDKGAVQCGFCTPGMIMSAKALLDKNKSPSRDQIREAIGGNICRCTGYLKIEEAVEDAACNMRASAVKGGDV
ncbi:MAG: (2Fe-2S)-binding protein [Pseudomonadota bacterium]|nr:(2Fe-2S)-binding protein [Pseudomonadota bacterium]